MNAFCPKVWRMRVHLVFMAGAILFMTAAAEAASRTWVQLGPPGGPVEGVAVATNGRTVYARTGAGVFKSTNGGRSWFRSSAGLRGALSVLRSAPGHPATVYAATTEGVFASFDAARTWTRRSRGLPAGGAIRDLEVAASNPSTLYAIVRTEPAESRFLDAVYRSVDAGASWSRVGRGLPGLNNSHNETFFDLAIHPARRDTAFVATSLGLFRTESGGSRWVRSGFAGGGSSFVAFDRKQPDRLYVRAADSKIFVSTNRGRTWTPRNEDFLDAGGLRVFAPDPTRAAAAYALTGTGRLFETTDAAATWHEIGEGVGELPWLGDLVPDPTRSGVLYLTRPAYDPREVSLLKSSNGGVTWRPAETGIQAALVAALAVDPATEDVYAGLSYGGLWRWRSSDASWTPLGFEHTLVLGVAVDPSAPGTLYAVADSAWSVFRSVDAGAHWERLGDLNTVSDIAVVRGVLYAAGLGAGWRWDTATSNWQVIGCGGDTRVISGVSSGSSAILWCNDVGQVESTRTDFLSYSQDGGMTWSDPRIHVPGNTTDIAIDPQDPNRVVVARAPDPMYPDTGGLSITTDGGRTWREPVFPGKPGFGAAAIDPLDSRHIVVSSTIGVLESVDGGVTWKDIRDGGLPGIGARLVFAPSGRLYAGTSGGVFVLLSGED